MIEKMTLDTVLRILEGARPSFDLTLEEGALRVWRGPVYITWSPQWVSLGRTADGFWLEVDAPLARRVAHLLEEDLLRPLKEIVELLEGARQRLEEKQREAWERGNTSAFLSAFLSWYPTGRELIIIGGQSEYYAPQKEEILGYTADGWTVRLVRADGVVNGWGESGLTREDLLLRPTPSGQ